MHIALFGTSFSKKYSKYIHHLIITLNEKGCKISIYKKFYEFLIKEVKISKNISIIETIETNHNIDMLLSIGGDGTLLRAVTKIKDMEIPILGINTGKLGFISSISTDEVDVAIEKIVKKEYKIHNRSLLELETDKELFGDINFALNEIAIVKKDTSSMIKIHTFLDNEFLNSYWADGLLISTPTGSTGYSLSCGGPIMLPGTGNFIIAPIAPHNLNVRPIIINENSVIDLQVEDRDERALLSLDSRSRGFNSNLKIRIKRSKFDIKLVQLKNTSFISTIRTKLMWGSDKRNI